MRYLLTPRASGWFFLGAMFYAGCGALTYTGSVAAPHRDSGVPQVRVSNHYAGRVEIFVSNTSGRSFVRLGSLRAYEVRDFKLPTHFAQAPVIVSVEDIRSRMGPFTSQSVLVTEDQLIELAVRNKIVNPTLTVKRVPDRRF